jgi:hypothetical protein
MEWTTILGLVASLVAAGATTVYAVFTRTLVRETQRMRQAPRVSVGGR